MLHPTPLLLLVAASLAGCAVGPDYLPKDPPMPVAYMGSPVVAPTNHTSEPADPALAAWWTGFADPQLTRYVMQALEQNLDMSQASARLLQARAELDGAGAALLPVGNVGAETSRGYQSVETPLGQVLASNPGFDRYGSAHLAQVGSSWELDFFGGLRRAQQASLADYQGAHATAMAVRLAVVAQTADSYLRIRGLQARLDVARKQVNTQQKLLDMVTLRFNKGLAAEFQMQQTQGALAGAQATIPVLEAALESAMNALDVMLGTSPGTHRAELALTRPIPTPPHVATTGSPATLLKRRPDLIAAERRLAASNARIGVAVAEYYPTVSLSGLIGSATSISSGNLFTSGASQAGATLGERWRLFDFGRINAQIAQAEAREAEALAAYRQAALRATEDVENALSSFGRRQEQTLLLERGFGALSRAQSATAAGYDKGVISLIEVMHADESLLNAQDAQVQAQTESARAAVAIFKALGGGWEPEQTPVVASK